MKLIAITDDHKGMMFNHRRQSKDQMLRKEILNLCKSKTLYMNAYTYSQFEENEKNNVKIHVAESFLSACDKHSKEKTEEDAYYFVENENLAEWLERISEIVLFQWNTRYPADFYFTIDLSEFHLVSAKDFPGNSHNNITMEIYKK